MPAGPNDTTIAWGTMDANGTAFHNQILAMIKDLQYLGVPAVQDVLTKYSVQKTDFGTMNLKVRKPDGTGFIGG